MLKVFGAVGEGYWEDVGSLEAYQRAHQDIAQVVVVDRIAGQPQIMGREARAGQHRLEQHQLHGLLGMLDGRAIHAAHAQLNPGPQHQHKQNLIDQIGAPASPHRRPERVSRRSSSTRSSRPRRTAPRSRVERPSRPTRRASASPPSTSTATASTTSSSAPRRPTASGARWRGSSASS